MVTYYLFTEIYLNVFGETIIMKASSLKILSVLFADNSGSVSGLSAKTGFSVSTVSEAIKELEEKGFVVQDGRKILAGALPFVNELKLLAGGFNLEKLFLESREKIVLALIEPADIGRLKKLTGLSSIQILRHLKGLSEIGAVSLNEKVFFLDEKIKNFAVEFKKFLDLKEIEPSAVLVFSNGFKLKKTPLDFNASGSLTAFSLFSQFGIDYAIVNDFFVVPEHDVSIEEVFVHSLVFSASKKDLAMSLLFYEKNKSKMEMQKILKLSAVFARLQLVFDCLAFLSNKPVREKEKFMPWSEFKVFAKNYGVNYQQKQKFSRIELEKLLFEIGKELKFPLTVFLIGGCNMALQDIKAATKDIDLVVKTQKDFDELKKTLFSLGFKQVKPETAYQKMHPSAIFEKEGRPRIDVFTKIVCNALVLSESIAKKAVQRKFGNLLVEFVSPEFIVLFKSITERDTDLEDISTIIRQQKINWPDFLKELDSQHEFSDKIFCLNVLDTIELLFEKEKIVVPVKQKILFLCLEKSILFLAKKPVSVKELLEKIYFSEFAVRNAITRLVKQKKLKKIPGKPFKIIAI